MLEEMKTNRVSNTHQVIASMIKGEYDDESNWQMVEYVFDKYNSEGCGYGLRLYNALLEALWWLGQKERGARVLNEATKRGLFPELYRQSNLVWSLDVHRYHVLFILFLLCISCITAMLDTVTFIQVRKRSKLKILFTHQDVFWWRSYCCISVAWRHAC